MALLRSTSRFPVSAFVTAILAGVGVCGDGGVGSSGSGGGGADSGVGDVGYSVGVRIGIGVRIDVGGVGGGDSTGG